VEAIVSTCEIAVGSINSWLLCTTFGETGFNCRPTPGEAIVGDVTYCCGAMRCGVLGEGSGYANEPGLRFDVGVEGGFWLINLGCLLGDMGISLIPICGAPCCGQSLLISWLGWVAVGRNVGGLVSPLFTLCSCDPLVIGVNKNRVGSAEFGVCLGVALAELGVTGRFCGVPGVLNFGDDWNGEGVCGIACCIGVVGDIIDGVTGLILEGNPLGVVVGLPDCGCCCW